MGLNESSLYEASFAYGGWEFVSINAFSPSQFVLVWEETLVKVVSTNIPEPNHLSAPITHLSLIQQQSVY